jgi:hypothetical protein
MALFFILLLIIWVFYKIYSNPNEWDRYSILGITILSGIGMRTIFITDSLNFHAMEFILFLSPVIYGYTTGKRGVLLNLLLVFCVFGLINSFLNTQLDKFDSKIGDFKGFVLLFPSIILTAEFVVKNRSWTEFGITYVITMAIVSFLGLIEYFVPGISTQVGGFYKGDLDDVVALDSDAFRRAKFSFWGAPTVGHIILLGIPIWLSIRDSNNFRALGFVRYAIFPLLLIGVFIAGARADWLILVVFFMLYYFVFNNIFLYAKTFVKSIIEIFMLVVLAYNFVSQSAIDRFYTGIFALKGNIDEIVDSSSKIRKFRIEEAIETIKITPLGKGWGNNGWVHADILQLTAAVGWFGGVIFILFYFDLLIKGISVYLKLNLASREKNIFAALIMCHIAFGYQFAVNGIYFWPITGIPHFILLSFLRNYVIKFEESKSFEIR